MRCGECGEALTLALSKLLAWRVTSWRVNGARDVCSTYEPRGSPRWWTQEVSSEMNNPRVAMSKNSSPLPVGSGAPLAHRSRAARLCDGNCARRLSWVKVASVPP